MWKIIKITFQVVFFYYYFTNINIHSFYSFVEWFLGLILAVMLFTNLFNK